MTIFKFVSIDESGYLKKGILEGDSIQHISNQLQTMGLIPIDITENKKNQIKLFFFTQEKISRNSLALLTYQVSIL